MILNKKQTSKAALSQYCGVLVSKCNWQHVKAKTPVPNEALTVHEVRAKWKTYKIAAETCPPTMRSTNAGVTG